MMQELFDQLGKWNIDLMIVLIVLLSGFFQNSYLTVLSLSKSPRTDSAYKTLILSLVISVIWIFFTHRGSKDPLPLAKYFFSYFAATSLYELLINPFRQYLIQKFGLGSSSQP